MNNTKFSLCSCSWVNHVFWFTWYQPHLYHGIHLSNRFIFLPVLLEILINFSSDKPSVCNMGHTWSFNTFTSLYFMSQENEHVQWTWPPQSSPSSSTSLYYPVQGSHWFAFCRRIFTWFFNFKVYTLWRKAFLDSFILHKSLIFIYVVKSTKNSFLGSFEVVQQVLASLAGDLGLVSSILYHKHT